MLSTRVLLYIDYMTKVARILIVDDERELIQILKYLFSGMGSSILYAHSGNEAIALLKKGGIELIISDYNMPDGTGGDLLKFVRKEFPSTHFYFHTASEHKELSDNFLKGVIIKPNSGEEITRLILDFLKSTDPTD